MKFFQLTTSEGAIFVEAMLDIAVNFCRLYRLRFFLFNPADHFTYRLIQFRLVMTHVAHGAINHEPLESLRRLSLEQHHLFGALLECGRVKPLASQFRRQRHWPSVMDVDHATRAIGGDDNKAVMLARRMLCVWILANRGTQDRRPVSTADQVGLFLRPAFIDPFKPTGMFNPEEAKYANGVVVDLPYPTDDVRLLTKAAVDALDRVFRSGFNYSKAEVMLLNLCQPGEYTDDLFAISQPAEATRVMAVLDEINGRWGRGTLRAASVPTNPDWGMRREMMSQSYTTKIDQLWKVSCV
jgi:hypothetical protein